MFHFVESVWRFYSAFSLVESLHIPLMTCCSFTSSILAIIWTVIQVHMVSDIDHYHYISACCLNTISPTLEGGVSGDITVILFTQNPIAWLVVARHNAQPTYLFMKCLHCSTNKLRKITLTIIPSGAEKVTVSKITLMNE